MPLNFPLCFILVCALLLGACSGSNPQVSAPPPGQNNAAEKCQGVYLFASSRYLINLVANEQVVIDPARHSIPVPVYCTPDEARKALKEARDSGKIPASMDLRIYQLDGEWRDMARENSDRHFLNKSAILLDVVE